MTDWPRLPWEAAHPNEPVPEHLAVVALARRVAAPFEQARQTAIWVDEHRRLLARAVPLLAAAGHIPEASTNVVVDASGVRRLEATCAETEGPLRAAADFGLCDEPLDLRRLPIELAATDCPDSMLMRSSEWTLSAAETGKGGERLWCYRHIITGAQLRLDAELHLWQLRRAPGHPPELVPYDDIDLAMNDLALSLASGDLGR